MKRSKSMRLERTEENFIFYTCLILVLAIAAFGVAADMLAGR